LQPDRYLVTPEPGDDVAWLHTLERALASGITRVQLRARTCPAERWVALVRKAARLCQQRGAEVLLNGDPMLAAELGIGVHLQAAQLRVLDRRPLSKEVPVAASCHGADELRLAQDLGCDFAVLGAVNATASHPGTPAMGWDGFAALREDVSLPIYGIGGMSTQDVATARRHGAQGVAAIRGLWPALL
jgi:8-oxo-dGTP diphosphatase